MKAPSIEIAHAHLDYENTILFDDLSLSIKGGQFTCLLGPSGVGKSSLLRYIAGLKSSATASDPIITSDHQPLVGRMAYLAQNELLLPWLTTLQNVMVGWQLRAEKITKECTFKAESLLERVGLGNYLHALPKQLSGGMKQRVLLARTIFEDKPVIFMDEPLGSLDVITRTSIQELVAELFKERTVLLVTHDPLEALRLGHSIYVMSGRPATISLRLNLDTPTPRELTDTDLQAMYAGLLDRLSHAKEVTQC